MTLLSALVVITLLCAVASLAGKLPVTIPVFLLSVIAALELWPLK